MKESYKLVLIVCVSMIMTAVYFELKYHIIEKDLKPAKTEEVIKVGDKFCISFYAPSEDPFKQDSAEYERIEVLALKKGYVKFRYVDCNHESSCSIEMLRDLKRFAK